MLFAHATSSMPVTQNAEQNGTKRECRRREGRGQEGQQRHSMTACESPGCAKEAKMQCPTCIKLGIKGSFFCSQTCFKTSWELHKALHKLAKGATASQNSKRGGGLLNFNPWPGYMFTGRLRPAEQSANSPPAGPIRIVRYQPNRPDYRC